MIIEELDSLLWFVALWTVVYTLSEQIRKPLQRVLIHWIDDGQVNDGEEEDGSTIGHWSVDFSSLIDFLLSHLGLLHSDVDFVGGLLTLLKHLDQLVVLKNVCNLGILCQSNKDLILNFSEDLSRLGILLDDVVLLLLELWHLLRHKLIEHLLFKTEGCDSEVENRDFDSCLW